MSKMKDEALELVESVLTKLGKLEDDSLHKTLIQELLKIGAAAFRRKYRL